MFDETSPAFGASRLPPFLVSQVFRSVSHDVFVCAVRRYYVFVLYVAFSLNLRRISFLLQQNRFYEIEEKAVSLGLGLLHALSKVFPSLLGTE